MGSKSTDTRSEEVRSNDEFRSTRRAVLASGGVVGLGGLTGCLHDSALDGLLDRGAEQLVGTTSSSPAAFYGGQAPPPDEDTDGDGIADGDDLVFIGSGDGEVKQVPATVRADSREIELEGWAVSTSATDENYNSPRSNRSEWWAGPDDDGDIDDDGDTIVAIQDVELELLAKTTAAASSISKRSARTGRNIAAMDDSNQDVRATAERCSEDVCKTILENADDRERLVGQAREHINNEEWDQAAAAVDEIRERPRTRRYLPECLYMLIKFLEY